MAETGKKVEDVSSMYRTFMEHLQIDIYVWRQYYSLIRWEKRAVLTDRIANAKGDSRKLYFIVKNLTGTKKTNPLPDADSEQSLADSFSDYFLDKIDRIRKNFQCYPKFQLETNGTLLLTMETFHPVLESEVKEAIMSIDPKSCELDVAPAGLFRKILDKMLPFLTKFFNCFV